jgi:hypothetical protein
MSLQAISSGSSSHRTRIEKTFRELWACRTQIPTLAIVADIAILVSAIFVVPYLIYIVYCVIADHLHHWPIVILWRFMRREFAAIQGGQTGVHISEKILDISRTISSDVRKVPSAQAEPLISSDGHMDPVAEVDPPAGEPQVLDDGLANPVAKADQPIVGTERPANSWVEALRNNTMESFDDMTTRIGFDVRNHRWDKPPWPDASSGFVDTGNTDVDLLSFRVGMLESAYLLTEEREKWKECKIAKIKAGRLQLDGFIASKKVLPYERSAEDPHILEVPESPSDPPPSATPTETKAELDDNIYCTPDGRRVIMPPFEEVNVSAAGNQCVWRSLAALLTGGEDRFLEVKRRFRKFMMFDLGLDADQFDCNGFRRRVQTLSDLLVGKAGAEDGCDFFSRVEAILPVARRLAHLRDQFCRLLEESSSYSELFDNSVYTNYVGDNLEFNEIVSRLMSDQYELLAFRQRMSRPDDESSYDRVCVDVWDMFSAVLCPEDMREGIPGLISMGDDEPMPEPLLGNVGTRLLSLWDVAVLLENHAIGCHGKRVFPVVAYLYNCTVNVWDYDAQPHTLEIYSPDDIQIPETHPRYAEIQAMRPPPGKEINILSKPLVSWIGHCRALLPK